MKSKGRRWKHCQAGMSQWYESQYAAPLCLPYAGRPKAPYQEWIEANTILRVLLIQHNYMRDNPNPADQFGPDGREPRRCDHLRSVSKHRSLPVAANREVGPTLRYHDLMPWVDAATQNGCESYSVAKGECMARCVERPAEWPFC